jgi:hypothetical protein
MAQHLAAGPVAERSKTTAAGAVIPFSADGFNRRDELVSALEAAGREAGDRFRDGARRIDLARAFQQVVALDRVAERAETSAARCASRAADRRRKRTAA